MVFSSLSFWRAKSLSGCRCMLPADRFTGTPSTSPQGPASPRYRAVRRRTGHAEDCIRYRAIAATRRRPSVYLTLHWLTISHAKPGDVIRIYRPLLPSTMSSSCGGGAGLSQLLTSNVLPPTALCGDSALAMRCLAFASCRTLLGSAAGINNELLSRLEETRLLRK